VLITQEALLAARAQNWETIQSGPVVVSLCFGLLRPKTSSEPFPGKRPDIDKLTRAVLDSLTDARIWRDDGQVQTLHACKTWSLEPGVDIAVFPFHYEH